MSLAPGSGPELAGPPRAGSAPGAAGARPARRRLLVVLLLLLVIGAGGAVGGVSLWTEYQFRAAQEEAERGQFARAEAHLRGCLALRPSNAAAHFLLARTARRAGDYRQCEESLEAYQRQLQGRNEAIALERALLRAEQGEAPPDLEAHLVAMTADHPDRVLILEALAQGAVRRTQWPRAMKYLNDLLEKQPANFRGRLLRGGVYEALGLDQEALRDYEQAVAANADSVEARSGLARLLYRVGRGREAAGQYERLRCAYDADDPGRAGQLLDGLLARHPDHFAALVERGRVAFRQGNAAAAEGWLRRALAVRPADRDASSFQDIVARVDAWFLLHLYQEAQGKDDARDSLARMDQLQSDLRRATRLTEELQASPRDADRTYELGMALLRLGREEQGLGALQTVLQFDPNHRGAQAALEAHAKRTPTPEARP